MNKKYLFVGVDGGGTKSVIRLEDVAGNLLGETVSGPANICISVEQAWQSILFALTQLLNNLTLNQSEYELHVGMGLAGTELIQAYDAFIKFPHTFNSLIVKSDAHIACLAAHGGRDGAIIIVGTGVVGYQIIQQKIYKVGGWGFPHDDDGGGAWLGLQAIKIVLRWLDKRMAESNLAQAIFAYFNYDRDKIIHWSRHATATLYATLAPLVIQQAQLGDDAAQRLLKEAGKIIDHLGLTLLNQVSDAARRGAIPLSFIGSITPFLQPYLSEELKAHVCDSKYCSAKGAILMVQDALTERSILKC